MEKQQTVLAPQKRDQRLDFVKLVSCIAVVVIHTLRNNAYILNTAIYHLCAFAVPCFFIASGVILLNKSKVTYQYAIGKILKVVRVIILWHIIYYGMSFLLFTCGNGFDSKQLINCGFLCAKNSIRCMLQRGPFWQFWYLGTMCLIYLMLPMLHKLLNPWRGLKRLAIFWGICASISVGLQLVSSILGFCVQEKVVQSFRVWTWFQYFCLGGLMPPLLVKVKAKLSMRKHIVLLCLASAMVVVRGLLVRMMPQFSKVEYFYDSPLTILWVALLFSCIMRLKSESLPHKFLRAFSPLIMGVYIVHVQVRMGLLSLWVVDGMVEQLAITGVTLVISFLIAQILRVIPGGKHLMNI